MHLKSITLKGFKSFPDRTRLEFGPGVSVVIGPNGSGKSNITDAVLWALGEQSPLAVRGQSMQDVIFGGARGQQARGAAEVELVIDAQGSAARPAEAGDGGLPFSEVSIRRRLDRTGEGEYRLNGARCRLVDVLEVLSDTGLGKEMHSVVSQGRVESVISSKPRDRRLLIEEAAGLGKHRKRRRRAQLKLARTQENVDRALDVEREARSRLRPLKRQAEAAELHERLERQSVEARWELARDAVRARRASLAEAESAVGQARAQRDEVERALAQVARRREEAEDALTRRGARHDALAARRFAARSSHERVALRLDQAAAVAASLRRQAAEARSRLDALEREHSAGPEPRPGRRTAELERQLVDLDRERGERLDDELAQLEDRRDQADAACATLEAQAAERRSAVAAAEQRCREAREVRRAAEAALESAQRKRARAAAARAAVDEFLRTRSARSAVGGAAPALADQLDAEPGYELALAAALAGRLGAALAPDLAAGAALLDRVGEDGGRVLIAGGDAAAAPAAARANPAGRPAARLAAPAPPPLTGAEPLVSRIRGEGPALALARALLADAWVVESLDALPEDFRGVAVTRAGRAWLAGAGELHQAPAGGEERVLAQRNRRSALAAEEGRAGEAVRRAEAEAEGAAAAVERADAARASADSVLGDTLRERERAAEERRRAAWSIDQRRSAPEQGPAARRRAEIEAALGAERQLVEQAERARRDRERRLESEGARLARCESLAPRAERLAGALAAVAAEIEARAAALEAELEADRAAGEGLATALRSCAQEEAQLQARLRDRGERVTELEVAAPQARDRAAEAASELTALAQRLELPAEPAADPLSPDEREALEQRVARLARRREQLGPVNPLAKGQYAEALAEVEELETQRRDLETALRELHSLIAQTDRRIRESFEATFEATARNFEELVGQLFPGGRGRLRLVRDDESPAPVLGGQALEDGERPEGEPDEEREAADEDEVVGVEIEMTPAGKAMKRLTLLSGGEKSLTALAFLFAVFLARPCPFYVLDEVEAALDDLNIDRFLRLLRRYSQRAQFIVVTHQKRTMEAADTLYGVSMGDDGISKVISRRLEPQTPAADAA